MSARLADRAVGSLIGLACGDALGAGYGFGPPLPADAPLVMGGRQWEPGEWTDDTAMAFAIAELAAAGARFDEQEVLDRLVIRWVEWMRVAKDVGIQISSVLRAAADEPTEARARAASEALHRRTGRSAGNGSLMRTAPLALAYLADGDEEALAGAARRVSELTHWDDRAGDACVIWSLALREAVRSGTIDVRTQIRWLPTERQQLWHEALDRAEEVEPHEVANNGWVVDAMISAWSAISRSDGPVDAIERAVRSGHDTDTVAAIVGGLVGAAHGVSALPARWRRQLHGWPSRDGAASSSRDLLEMAVLATRGGRPDADGWPSAPRFAPSSVDTLVRHPHDSGVWLASLAGLDRLPAQVDAVVSLCRTGRAQTALETVEFWLVDRPGANANLAVTLDDAANTVAALRAEGKRVVIHCFEGASRTPTVAAVYAARHLGVPAAQALDEVSAALPRTWVNREFAAHLRGLDTGGKPSDKTAATARGWHARTGGVEGVS
ncbi:ADP-ribosylglycohydrolase family protein [Schumannella sp. 10F1B-5-1]|uniref:ADP-ribosylglycohydrolase family protein n=1 Tax=Schumannella sp. 10F1B-5-1 TaxID=2590780 RepID=UPI001130BF02|nr:ADP-ribosylglycohydrolase family protein [Schumannella sp. 10F1B-5-1]TPW72894.1 ADP-ribosylglycohydrolase family protein [Schumannella sp. 10F1B-5-1]